MKYMHGTKWVLIKPVDAYFIGELQVEFGLALFED